MTYERDRIAELKCVISDLCEQVRERDAEIARLNAIIARANTAEMQDEARKIHGAIREVSRFKSHGVGGGY